MEKRPKDLGSWPQILNHTSIRRGTRSPPFPEAALCPSEETLPSALTEMASRAERGLPDSSRDRRGNRERRLNWAEVSVCTEGEQTYVHIGCAWTLWESKIVFKMCHVYAPGLLPSEILNRRVIQYLPIIAGQVENSQFQSVCPWVFMRLLWK